MLRLGSAFFSTTGAICACPSSEASGCSGTGAVSCFGAVATVLRCRFGFFLFRFVNLNHLAGLKLIRKIRRSRLLCLRHLCTGEANTSAHNEGAHDAGNHGENVLPMSQERQIKAAR